MSQVAMSEICSMPSFLPTPTPFETLEFQQGVSTAISGTRSENSVSKGKTQALWLGKGGLTGV